MSDVPTRKRVAVLISGRGSNMSALIGAAMDPAYPGEIVAVLSNKPDAGGLATAARYGIPAQAVDQRAYADRGFSVVGFPSNQFLQEPGSTEEILDYCATTWGVSFPVFDKVKVNGRSAAPLYKELKRTADADGKAGRVAWNFEKVLVLPSGEIHRFRPQMKPDDPAIVGLIEANLPA